MRYRLSGNSHPGSAKNPGPDLAEAEVFERLPFSPTGGTIDIHVLQRQGGLDIGVQILTYVDSWSRVKCGAGRLPEEAAAHVHDSGW